MKVLIQHINAAPAELEKMKARIKDAFSEMFMKRASTSDLSLLIQITRSSSRKRKRPSTHKLRV